MTHQELAEPNPPTPPLYIGFWRRVVAWMIDMCLVSVVLNLIFFGSTAGMGIDPNADPQGAAPLMLISMLLATVVSFFYTTLCLSSKHQATLGFYAIEAKATDYQGQRLSFGRSVGRYCASWISVFTLGIGYLMVGWTQRKQALHDKIAGTVVVANPPAELSFLPQEKLVGFWRRMGASFIDMVIGLALWAVVAVPALMFLGDQMVSNLESSSIVYDQGMGSTFSETFSRFTGWSLPLHPVVAALWLLWLLVALYVPYLLCLNPKWQASPGMRVVGIKVVDQHNQTLTWKKLLIWALGGWGLLYFSGFGTILSLLCTRYKQMLPDKLFKVVFVKR